VALHTERARGLATLDAAPELPLGRDDEVLVERVGMGGDREAVRKVVLMPAVEGPIAIWDGEPKRSSLNHDSVHDEP